MPTKKRPATMMAAIGRRKTLKKVEIKPKQAATKATKKAAPVRLVPVPQNRASTSILASPSEVMAETVSRERAPETVAISEREAVAEEHASRQKVDDKSCDPRIEGMACYGCRNNDGVFEHELGVGVRCGLSDHLKGGVSPRRGCDHRLSKQKNQEAA